VAKIKKEGKRSVLFVCAANQCRSPMAMVLFKDLVSRQKAHPENWIIESAGVWAINGYPASKSAIQAMNEIGLDLNDHHSQPVTELLIDEFDLVLCMELEQVFFLKKNFPFSKEKIFLLSEMAGNTQEIWDPVGLSMSSYKETAKEMLSIMEDGFSKIMDLTS
jgi:protein-tyrosine-phosphatase